MEYSILYQKWLDSANSGALNVKTSEKYRGNGLTEDGSCAKLDTEMYVRGYIAE
jgi:hypothetical protein